MPQTNDSSSVGRQSNGRVEARSQQFPLRHDGHLNPNNRINLYFVTTEEDFKSCTEIHNIEDLGREPHLSATQALSLFGASFSTGHFLKYGATLLYASD